MGTSVTTTVVLALCLLTSSCGLRVQEHPVGLGVAAATAPVAVTVRPGTQPVRVYLVCDSRLASVRRAAGRVTVSTALALLTAGPTRGEAAGGLGTSLAPQPLAVARVGAVGQEPGARGAGHGHGSGTVVVSATRQFAALSGPDQLLAVAQVVWTLTGLPGVDSVRLTIEGERVEVPTDRGLRRGLVDRDDYSSVAPVRHPSPCTPGASGASGGALDRAPG